MTATTGSSRLSETVHGVLTSVLGAGILIRGDAGIGKSDCVLELVLDGHQLVADDVVCLRRENGVLIGGAPDKFAGLLSIRGVGIIDIRMLTVSAFKPQSMVDLCIDFRDETLHEELAESASSETTISFLGVTIPRFAVLVTPPRRLKPIVELFARQHSTKPHYAEKAA